ncbi:MAG: hypothetical protein ACLUFR_03710 [Megamonas funiformis]|uniref:hypothetical protein n=1 Tax=Megamonas funiformis TaxID=437897 RepID=UPI0039961C2C
MSERDLRATPLVMPDQRASTATKQTKAWYIPNCNYWINLAIGQNDKTVTQKFLDAANGLVDLRLMNMFFGIILIRLVRKLSCMVRYVM